MITPEPAPSYRSRARLVRRTPMTAGPISATTRMTVSEKPSLGPRRRGAETNEDLLPNMAANVGTAALLGQSASAASASGLNPADATPDSLNDAAVQPIGLAAQFVPFRRRPGAAV